MTDLKGEALGRDSGLSSAPIVAMPGPSVVREKSLHPTVSINGTVYTWQPGQEDGIPEEALVIWRRYLQANADG